MWLGEQITERGIGQGISIIITVGIMAGFPSGVFTVGKSLFTDTNVGLLHLVILIALIVVAVGWYYFHPSVSTQNSGSIREANPRGKSIRWTCDASAFTG